MSTYDNTPASRQPVALRSVISLDLVQRAMLWLWIASGWMVIIEPAPYEFLFLLTLGMMLPAGLKFHTAAVPLTLFLMLYNIGGGFSVLPVTGEEDTKQFMIVSVYLAGTSIFLANILADDTEKRIAVIKNAYIIAAVIASILGMIGFFNIAGLEQTWAPLSRAQGTFKDPNVMSTFIIPPAIFLIQDFLMGKQKWPISAAVALVIIIAALFFAFSRGAWANAMAAGLMLVGMTFILTPSPKLRGRIVLVCMFGLAALVGLFFIALSFESIRTFFGERANLVNSYDGGETGRFGRQLRSLPYLLDLPNGYGPLQFAKVWGQDPHNVFINAFAAYGWLGGLSYILLIISTIAIGVKTVFTRTPWQAFALAVFAPLVMVILQGIQIDTDHWRHFYLQLGLMWGLYAATVKYQANR